ncbi:MAG TPA: SgcJ/EcaC family oxidoreductase [Pirellulaceae bacterium]|nr:SgcJ/EcaC family oxidoreductase [Pirellulaceae bacterium]HMP69162.1 SgcJ/EcaC family oxidoreductase [Pirellulaceae bacterium]
MIRYKLFIFTVALTFQSAFIVFCAAQTPGDESIDSAFEGITKAFISAFNDGQADAVAELFVEDGELIIEDGTIYQGRTEIKQLLSEFFEAFPGTKASIEPTASRVVSGIMIADGIRTMTNAEGESANVRYTAILVRSGESWKIASLRDVIEQHHATPGELLQPLLGWLVGEWVNEGSDARVSISYQWSEDQNFILGEFVVTQEGVKVGTSSHRIGWDPILLRPRSWLFDSDGGFSEATWTEVDGRWLLRSSAVLPDGQTGSAVLTISAVENDRFTLSGTSRLVGHDLEDDYEIAVVRRPPNYNR